MHSAKSGLIPCVVGDRTSITLEVTDTTRTYGFDFGLGPGNTIFPQVLQGNVGGGQELSANINQTNTIAIRVNGSEGVFLLNESLALRREMRDRQGTAETLVALGRLAQAQGMPRARNTAIRRPWSSIRRCAPGSESRPA